MAQAHAIPTTDVTTAQIGMVLANEVRGRDGRLMLPKGTVLDAAALASLPGAEPTVLHLLDLDPDELHEDDGGLRVANAIAGSGVGISGPAQSRVDLVADLRGVVRVDAGLVCRINEVDGVTVYTMLDWQPVTPETVIASVKITPIAIREEQIIATERLCQAAERPALSIAPFQPKRVAVLTTDPLDTERLSAFSAAMERKVDWYGSSLVDLRVVNADAADVADAMRGFLRDGVEIILAAGGNAIDPLDPINLALPLIDAQIVHSGAPTRGSMFWLAEAGDVSIVSVASVRMLSATTAADAFLLMLFAGHRVTRDDILDVGVGGLPGSAIRLRFPQYDVAGDA